MEYGILYVRLVPKKGHFSWIRYCHIYNALPQSIQDGIKEIVTYINKKYYDDIVIPLGLDVQMGCVVKLEKINIISKDLYNKYINLLNDLSIEPNIRLVYSIGEINIANVKSVHRLYSDKVIIKVGHYLDESNEPGLYKI